MEEKKQAPTRAYSLGFTPPGRVEFSGTEFIELDEVGLDDTKEDESLNLEWECIDVEEDEARMLVRFLSGQEDGERFEHWGDERNYVLIL